MNWTIRRKLYAVIALSVAVSGGGSAVALVQVQNLRDAQREYTSQVQVFHQLDSLANYAAIIKHDALLTTVLGGKDPSVVQRMQADIGARGALLSAVKASAMTSGQAELLAQYDTGFGEYLGLLKGPPVNATDPNAGRDFSARLEAALGNATASMTKLQASFADRQRELQDVSDTAATRLLMVVGLTLAAVLGAGIFQALTARSLSNRIGVLRGSLDQIADGDLRADVPVTGSDEISEMATSLNKAARNLREVLSSTAGAGRQMGEAARGLLSFAGNLTEASVQASRQADQVASSASSVSAHVQSVATSSHQLGEAIGEIARNAQEAVSVADDAVSGVQQSTQTMAKLADSSREIGDVIRLITAIAEQTNLLALNATIEAARAGAAGKGFAVVADEVKQLAQETGRATTDISDRVEAIQADAVRASSAIEQIAVVIGRINEFQTTIASAVEEQSASTEGINEGVSHAAEDTQAIATSIATVAASASVTATEAEHARASADELSRVSSDLEARLAGFRF